MSSFYREDELVVRFHEITGRDYIGSNVPSVRYTTKPPLDAEPKVLDTTPCTTLPTMKEEMTSTSTPPHVILEAQASSDIEKPHILRHHHHVPYPHGWKCHFCPAIATLKCVSCEDDFYCNSCYDRIHRKSDKSVLPFFVHHKSIPLVEASSCSDPKGIPDVMMTDKLSDSPASTHFSNYPSQAEASSSSTHSVRSTISLSSPSSSSHPTRSTRLYPSLK
jgi:hypothetical protein